MAKKDSDSSSSSFDPSKTSGMEARSFDGELQKDANDFHVKDSQWTHARNAINNSTTGDVGRMGNEPANRLCIKVWQTPNPINPLLGTGALTIIGFINLVDDKWVVFSTDNTHSEIGYFEENICRYTRIVNADCLGFKTTNIIYGQSRENYDCSWSVYWADGLNPDRYLNIGDIKYAPFAQPWPNVPWFCHDGPPQFAQSCATTGLTPTPCVVCTPVEPLTLVCDKTRLEEFFRPICLKVSKGADGGELLNGSYYAVAAYTINGQRVTDYSIPSNVQPLFDHNGAGGSLQIEICDIEKDNFDEFELVIVSVIAQQTVARKIGIYSTSETFITIDIINVGQDTTVPLNYIRVINPIYDTSDAMYSVNEYLIRIAPTAKFQFNYQPLANQIGTKWVSVEYPEDYYVTGGSNTGYMRDEVYSFFIRWVYKTGDKSASFHIPGRPKRRDTALSPNGQISLGISPAPGYELYNNGTPVDAPNGPDDIEQSLGIPGPVNYTSGLPATNPEIWQQWNTAQQVTLQNPYTLCDGGIVIAEGYMGYWESSEQYPDDKPEIWNASNHQWSCLAPNNCTPPQWPYPNTQLADYDLCGKYIRHHRFPDNDLTQQTSHFRNSTSAPSVLSNPDLKHIHIMGVKFENIRPPVDNDGNLIPDIVGYEILRGSRVGNRSVIAKGIINNMWEYSLDITNDTTNVKGLYQNYPYNDLHTDQFLSITKTKNNSGNPGSNPQNANFYTSYKQNIFSFHSPETNFANPYLSSVELKLYQQFDGRANMNIGYVDKHPRSIFIKDAAVLMALTGGIGLALLATTGKQSTERTRRGNISNFPGALYEYEVKWKYNYNLNISGYTNGSVNSSENYSDHFTNENEHPLATQGESDMVNNVNSSIESDESSFFNNPAGGGVSKNLSQVGLQGRGYSKDSNSLKSAMDQFDSKTYDINKNIGIQHNPRYTYEWGMADYIPTGLYLFSGMKPQFLYYVTEGAELIWRALYAFSTPQRHELQTISHCLYDHWISKVSGQRRRIIVNQAYIDNQVHTFTEQYRINNLYRGRYVAMEISGTFSDPTVADDTRVNTALRYQASNSDYENVNFNFQRTSSTNYAAIKQRIRNQYGQLDSIVQVPISCAINICNPGSAPGGTNGLRTLPEGYEGLRLPPLSQCTPSADVRLVHGDFPNTNDIGNDLPNAVNPWVRDSVSQYWRQTTVSIAGTNYTVAKNDGPGSLINPFINTDLIQYFQAPHNSLVPGGILPNGGNVNNFSFDLIEFPETDQWKLETWLGDPDVVGNGVLVNTYTAVSTSFPRTITISSPTLPNNGVLDRLVFRVKIPSAFSPTHSSAQFVTFSNRYTASTLNKQHDWYAQYYRNLWIPKFQSILNDTKNNFVDGDFTQIRVDKYPAFDLYAGNNISNSEINFWPNYNGTPTNWQCLFGTKANNYVTNITCPTKYTYQIDVSARSIPFYIFQDLCTGSGNINTIVCQNTNPTETASCQAAVQDYYDNYPFPNPNAPFPPTSYDLGCTNGHGISYFVPSAYNGPYYCAKPGKIRISLNRISNVNPGSVGVVEAWILDGSTQGGNAGSYYMLNDPPWEGALFENLSLTGSVDLNPINSTADRYIIVIDTERCQFSLDGLNVTLDTCIENPPISITNVCLNVPNIPPNPIVGCDDPSAPNFVPNSTSNPFNCCQSFACVQGQTGSVGATNAVTNYSLGAACVNPANNQPYMAYVHQASLCNVPTSVTPNIGNLTETIGVGYCNWPCINNFGVNYIGAATYNTNGTIKCPTVTAYQTYPLFGGDIYINRYTEKNSFFYFQDWMYDLPDKTEWDYLKYRMFPYPSYWYNSEALSITEIVDSWYNFITDPVQWVMAAAGINNLLYPSKFHCLDRPTIQLGLIVKLGYIYLFNSGVRDFFVESEYNVDLRDFGDNITQRHYQAKGRDSFTDIYEMFKSGVIRAGNYYKYDTSLSIGKITYTYDPWGTIYPRFYDPDVAETCYQYLPQKLLYSLPATQSIVRDNWRIYLTDNSKTFKSNITCVKAINKSGILILFDSDSPVMFQGTDQLQTELSTALVIGNGGLFTQPSQSLMNADNIFQFGSCQNKLSVVNTPVGTYWVSADQGKIFQFSSGLEEISTLNMKWWLAQFLPFQLTKYFPNYKLVDNPVTGIGVQTVYDNTNALVYFSKKDWKPILNALGTPLVQYDSDKNQFYVLLRGTQTRVTKELGDPEYFQDASWTISYDVKTKGWVSFHDWHPALTSGTTNYFMTTKDNGIWMHNDRFDLYTNYYGIDYPFEIEYLVNTVQEVNTLRSIEYQLEVYRYKANGYDRYHVLDINFDEAIVYNTEQCSGLLKLNLTPKNNGPLITTFPQVNPTNIQILYSKEENKYRFNQFWDATTNRGEFKIGPVTATNPTGIVVPPAPTQPALGGDIVGSQVTREIFNTEPNGYVKVLNAINLNYSKSQLERKKFRHYTSSVFLRRTVSGSNKMLMSIANNKYLNSPR